MKAQNKASETRERSKVRREEDSCALLPWAEIRTDGGTQSRAEINDSVVEEYSQALDALPPVVVFFDGKDYWLADGFHRLAAYEKAGRTNVIPADVRQGTQRDAILYSVGANATHGLRRSNADKRKAVMTLLADQEWSGWPQGQIAQHCGVSRKLVNEVAQCVTGLHIDESPPRTVVKGDGKRYPASLPKRPAPAEEDEAEDQDIREAEADLFRRHGVEPPDDDEPFDLEAEMRAEHEAQLREESAERAAAAGESEDEEEWDPDLELIQVDSRISAAWDAFEKRSMRLGRLGSCLKAWVQRIERFEKKELAQ